jgi:uncharacterized lipoprotein YmbA
MMRRMGSMAVAAAALSAVLAGCASSPPLHYYTLSETAANTRVSLPADTIPIRLDRVTIPTELDRKQLVRRIDPTRLQIVEDHRWAAPLDDMIRRVLSDNLAARLPAGLVTNPNEPPVGERRQSLSVDIQELYADGTCAVALRASWVLKRPDSQSMRASEEVRIPAPGACSGAEAQPGAMSQALGQLSDRIAAGIGQASPASSH